MGCFSIIESIERLNSSNLENFRSFSILIIYQILNKASQLHDHERQQKAIQYHVAKLYPVTFSVDFKVFIVSKHFLILCERFLFDLDFFFVVCRNVFQNASTTTRTTTKPLLWPLSIACGQYFMLISFRNWN